MAKREKHLPVSINVTNQTGGLAGSNGLVFAMNQLDVGYTLVWISASNVTAVVQGGWDQKFVFCGILPKPSQDQFLLLHLRHVPRAMSSFRSDKADHIVRLDQGPSLPSPK